VQGLRQSSTASRLARSFMGGSLQVRDILAAIAIFINGAKGYSALQLSRDLCISLQVCVRSAAQAARGDRARPKHQGTLSGEVEVDGAYFGGYVKPANERKDRKGPPQKGEPVRQASERRRDARARRQLPRPHVAPTEAHGVALVAQNVEAGSTVHADEACALGQAGSALSDKAHQPPEKPILRTALARIRLRASSAVMRRSEIGIHHHIAGKYLQAYASEMAFREDARRESNGAQFLMLAGAAAAATKSKDWCGYWQR
jgi:hypothetical protein